MSTPQFPPHTPFQIPPKVLEVLSDLFIHIFDELNRNCQEELEAVRQQHPFQDLRYARPTLRLTFQEGIQLLIDAGYDGTWGTAWFLLLIMYSYGGITSVCVFLQQLVAVWVLRVPCLCRVRLRLSPGACRCSSRG